MSRGPGTQRLSFRRLRRSLSTRECVALVWLASSGCSGGTPNQSPDASIGKGDATSPHDDASPAGDGPLSEASHGSDGAPGGETSVPHDAAAADVSTPAPDAGASLAISCTNGVQDDGETGVDCGGPCPACVTYMVDPPNTNTKVNNACTDTGDVSFICPRFMLLSSEMREAAAADEAANGWPAGSFNYGVATLNGAACCACFQIVYGSPQDTNVMVAPPKPLVIQNFNTGGAPNAFDVFMGKGGEGANTAGCSALYSTYPTIGEPNGGGITAPSIAACTTTEAMTTVTTTASLESSACVSAVTSDCDMIAATSSYVATTTQFSCIETNSAAAFYHANWSVKAQEVECPAALTEVTGCKLNPGSSPAPDPTVRTVAEASSWSSYSTTTMEDCCKPSCAWPGNVSGTESPWSAMYQCDGSGNPMEN